MELGALQWNDQQRVETYLKHNRIKTNQWQQLVTLVVEREFLKFVFSNFLVLRSDRMKTKITYKKNKSPSPTSIQKSENAKRKQGSRICRGIPYPMKQYPDSCSCWSLID